MKNVQLDITDDKLVITIDLAQDHGFTKGLRGVMVATTEGNLQLWRGGQPIPDNLRLNLNCFRNIRPEEDEKAQQVRREQGKL